MATAETTSSQSLADKEAVMADTATLVDEFCAREARCFIDGGFVSPSSGGSFDTVDPATEHVLAGVARGGAADIDAAVAAAIQAFKSDAWTRSGPLERAGMLWRL